MKKIVIVPVFCEAHLVRFQIPNIIDTIDPDVIIYNEGMFPAGPEGSTMVDSEFLETYTLDGVRGFDYNEMKSIVEDARKQYPNTEIILNEMNYDTTIHNSSYHYVQACSNFADLGVDVQEGDYIFPFEGDVFHLESSRKEIQGYMEQLEPNQGFKSIWIDFVQNQHYVEKYTLKPFEIKKDGRHRKICVRFGDMDFYKDVTQNFMTQKYEMLFPTDLITYHYAWWRPGKYKDLRMKQLNRDFEPGHWEFFDECLEKMKNMEVEDEILVRPHLKKWTNGWIKKYEFEHPKIIQNHENWRK